jgi:hypothetical protein
MYIKNDATDKTQIRTDPGTRFHGVSLCDLQVICKIINISVRKSLHNGHFKKQPSYFKRMFLIVNIH